MRREARLCAGQVRPVGTHGRTLVPLPPVLSRVGTGGSSPVNTLQKETWRDGRKTDRKVILVKETVGVLWTNFDSAFSCTVTLDYDRSVLVLTKDRGMFAGHVWEVPLADVARLMQAIAEDTAGRTGTVSS